MPAPGIRICATCGTRNNPKWEFCVRCGEALQQESDFETTTGEHEAGEAEPRQGGGVPWRSILTLAGAGAAIAAALAFEPTEKPTGRLIQVPVAVVERPPRPSVTQVPDGFTKLREGHALLAQGKPQAALGPLAEAAEADPDNPAIQLVYARALWAAGSREDAASRFEMAARLGGKGSRTEYGNALLQMNRTVEAREVFEQALAERPDDVKALEILGQLHNREGRPAEAVAILVRATILKPDDPQLMAHLGYALVRSGDPGRAAEVLAEVVTRVPGSTIARELLAEAEFKQGKREEAVTLLREGLERKPDSPDLHRRLGSLLERTGRAAEAASAYREYVRLRPDAADAGALAAKAALLERTAANTRSPS